MCNTHKTDKHTVIYFITNLNNAHSEPARQTGALTAVYIYIYKTITVNFQEPKRGFKEKAYLNSFSVEIALKICNLIFKYCYNN